MDDVCLAGAIMELCNARDSGIVQIIDCNQICNLIDLIIIQIKSGVLIIMIFKTELFDPNNFFYVNKLDSMDSTDLLIFYTKRLNKSTFQNLYLMKIQ